MYDIDRKLLENYDLNIVNIMPFREGYVINTTQGKRFFKKSLYSAERIMFIHGVKEHLFNNGFRNTDRYICTREGIPFFNEEGSIYILSDYIDGNECIFDNRQDVQKAARLLAQLHKASKGFIQPLGSVGRDDLGRLPQYFSRRLEEIKKLRKIAKRGKSKFDYLFMEHADYFYDLGESVVQSVSCKTYTELVETAKKERSFCHHDFTHHNLVIRDGVMHILNFDYCCYELKTYDIANFIRRKMRKCNWNIKEARFIIDQYRKIEPLKEEDFFILRLMLQFPQKLWRVVNKYYNSRRSWSERSYIAKLQEVIDEVEYHRVFMNEFDSLM